jgi:hypothetical protein
MAQPDLLLAHGLPNDLTRDKKESFALHYQIDGSFSSLI